MALSLLAFSMSGCVGGDRNAGTRPPGGIADEGVTSTNSARTNVEELTLLINVPYETEDVVWKEDAASRRVVAVLRFSPADADRVAAEAAGYGGGENISIAVETWFPGELIAQGEMSGDSALKAKAYPANGFYQEPYNSGRIARIEGGDYFVLEMSAR